MYISFDYKCQPCEVIDPRFVKKTEMDDQKCQCGEKMTRLPAGTKTTFRFADTKLKD